MSPREHQLRRLGHSLIINVNWSFDRHPRAASAGDRLNPPPPFPFLPLSLYLYSLSVCCLKKSYRFVPSKFVITCQFSRLRPEIILCGWQYVKNPRTSSSAFVLGRIKWSLLGCLILHFLRLPFFGKGLTSDCVHLLLRPFLCLPDLLAYRWQDICYCLASIFKHLRGNIVHSGDFSCFQTVHSPYSLFPRHG